MSVVGSKLYVVTPTKNVYHFAGINHAHAVQNIQGGAIFAFRELPLAFRVASGIDDRLVHGKLPAISEELLSPFSHLTVGQEIELKYPDVVKKNLINLNIGKVDENEVLSYCAALQISCIILGYTTSKDTVFVQEILSPERSLVFSAGFLDFLYNKDFDE